MKNNYNVLSFLDSEKHSFLEIKDLSVAVKKRNEGSEDFWLKLDKDTNTLRRLDFLSRNSLREFEERIFVQGKLQYDRDKGIYSKYSSGDKLFLEKKNPETFVDNFEDMIQIYLRKN
ncbi:hypothetical protein [Aureivirga sp. CE67]|uniref:hypothetical protein n=1 Tax=Aureivirga sp. CE67 TaxID=1788983 RepID=UPI0018CA33A0|nr:hypothetical protein [Aureivirga sp. CE67]